MGNCFARVRHRVRIVNEEGTPVRNASGDSLDQNCPISRARHTVLTCENAGIEFFEATGGDPTANIIVSAADASTAAPYKPLGNLIRLKDLVLSHRIGEGSYGKVIRAGVRPNALDESESSTEESSKQPLLVAVKFLTGLSNFPVKPDESVHDEILTGRRSLIMNFKCEAMIMNSIGEHDRLVRFLGVLCEETAWDRKWQQARYADARANKERNPLASRFTHQARSMPSLDEYLDVSLVSHRLARLAQKQTYSFMDLRAFGETIGASLATAGTTGFADCQSDDDRSPVKAQPQRQSDFTEMFDKIIEENRRKDTEELKSTEEEQMRNLRRLGLDVTSIYCLVTELMLGGNLADNLCLLKTKKTHFDWQTAMGIMLDVAEGMAYLHSQSVVHRDLKSSNVLLTHNFRAKIADFGMAREIVPHELGQYTTCGTPVWLAPEMCRLEGYSVKVDVYSFSLVLWHILSRSLPFRGLSTEEVSTLVSTNKLRPPLPDSSNGHVPERLKRLIEACWHDSQARRPNFEKIQIELYKAKDQIEVEDLFSRLPLWEDAERQQREKIYQCRNAQTQQSLVRVVPT